MGERITAVTIVGGGTAGWLTALILTTAFRTQAKSGNGNGEARKVTLIESPNVSTVGVGEATVPAMPRLLQQMGIPERDFFKHCNASFKLGVLFDNWNVDSNGKRIAYINSFNEAPVIGGVDAAHYFLKYGAGGHDFSRVVSPALDLGLALKGPRPLNAKPFTQGAGFAYHLDAGRFAELLSAVCVARGVEHIRDDVEDIETDERGFITALTLKERGAHPVELVIDCTGFRGFLINKALGEPFVDYSRYLANDRAAAVQIPHPDPERIEPLTRSTALGAGWVWRVPLYSRVGTGYVFSSAHRSDDEAGAELLDHLAPQLGGAAKDATPRFIPMRVGRTRRPWVKNCVAIGLSSGFIEPLESTAIYMIEMSARWLLAYFPDKDFAEPTRDRYNTIATQLYDEVRDFICLHYALGNRTDSQYWIDAREDLEVPDSLAANLALWKHAVPTRYDLAFPSLFSYRVYHAVMLGKQVYQTGYADPPRDGGVVLRPAPWRDCVKQTRRAIDAAVKALPDHRTLLANIRGEGGTTSGKTASGPKLPAKPKLPGAQFQMPTVPLPGQAAPLQPVITTKAKKTGSGG